MGLFFYFQNMVFFSYEQKAKNCSKKEAKARREGRIVAPSIIHPIGRIILYLLL